MFKRLKRFILFIVVAVLAVAAYFVHDGYELYKSVIEETPLIEMVSNIRKDENFVEIDNVSEYLKKATVSIEDRRFYDHFGIDLYSIGRAFVNNFENQKVIGGGSSITQQVAKNMYFDQKKKLTRKVAEVFVALDLEEAYSKDEILELYLNIIYYGDGYYGIKEATEGYLEKEPNELNLDEASLLAGIPNAPSVYALTNNTKLTYQRQIIVLDAMVDTGDITKEERDELVLKINEKMGEM